MATTAALATDNKATVFDPAGVHPETVRRQFTKKSDGDAAIKKANDNVTGFRYKGEVLGIQDNPIIGLGLPNTLGKIITIDSKQHSYKPFRDNIPFSKAHGSIDRHSIDNLIKALDPKREPKLERKK